MASNQEFIHPYFDDIENDCWLSATIKHSSPCVVQFSVVAPLAWSPLLADRVCFHFHTLELGKLYSIQAAVEISMIQAHLRKMFQISGVVGIQKYLSDEEESRTQANINSWQAVFYRSAMQDAWFCNGGFDQ